MYRIPENDRELLGECRLDVFRGRGPGGQSVNTTDSAVRLTHLPSGAVVTARDERSQLMNKRKAIKRMREKLELMNYRPPARFATKPTRAAKQRRLDKKKLVSSKKVLRRTLPKNFDELG